MPEAFITSKTPDEVTIDFGGENDQGVFMDGNMVIRKDDSFFNWTFDELQKINDDVIIYVEDDDGN